MDTEVNTVRVARPRRFHWLLVVVAAVVAAAGAGSLTVILAQAQQKATDEATFRKLLGGLYAAWSTGDVEKAAPFFAKDADLVFYDVSPFKFHGWKEYHDAVQKEFGNLASDKLTLGDDFRVTRRGNVAWTTVTMHYSETTKDGKKTDSDFRHTVIWERRAGKWLIVHEHLSAPAS